MASDPYYPYFTLILWSLQKAMTCLEQTAFLCEMAGQEEVARNVLPLELQPGAEIRLRAWNPCVSVQLWLQWRCRIYQAYIQPISNLAGESMTWFMPIHTVHVSGVNFAESWPDTSRHWNQDALSCDLFTSPISDAIYSFVSQAVVKAYQNSVERCAQAKRSALGLPSSQSCFRFVPRTSSRLSAMVKHALKSTVSCSSNTPVGLTGFGAKGPASRTSLVYLVGGLEPWNFMTFHILGIINHNHPNWRSHIFQRGRAQPPTRYDFWPFFGWGSKNGCGWELLWNSLRSTFSCRTKDLCCFVEAQYSSLFGWDSWIAAFRF